MLRSSVDKTSSVLASETQEKSFVIFFYGLQLLFKHVGNKPFFSIEACPIKRFLKRLPRKEICKNSMEKNSLHPI